MSTLSRLLRNTPRTALLDRYIKSDITGHEPPPYVQMMEHAEKLECELANADSLYVAALDLAVQAQRELAARGATTDAEMMLRRIVKQCGEEPTLPLPLDMVESARRLSVANATALRSESAMGQLVAALAVVVDAKGKRNETD